MRRARLRVKINPFKKFKYLVILLLSVSVGIIFFESDFFKIRSIDVNLTQISCTDEKSIKEKSNILNKNIFFINEKSINENLKNKFICIKNTQFTKNLPNRIIVNVKGRIPVAKLIPIRNFEASTSALVENMATPSASLDESFIVDDEGVIFSKDSADVPKIYILGKTVSIGGKLEDEYLNKTLFILKLLKDLRIDYYQMFIFDNFLITGFHPKIVFRLDRDKSKQIASLQLILQKAKIDNKDLEFIDLRFDKPIIKYAPRK